MYSRWRTVFPQKKSSAPNVQRTKYLRGTTLLPAHKAVRSGSHSTNWTPKRPSAATAFGTSQPRMPLSVQGSLRTPLPQHSMQLPYYCNTYSNVCKREIVIPWSPIFSRIVLTKHTGQCIIIYVILFIALSVFRSILELAPAFKNLRGCCLKVYWYTQSSSLVF